MWRNLVPTWLSVLRMKLSSRRVAKLKQVMAESRFFVSLYNRNGCLIVKYVLSSFLVYVGYKVLALADSSKYFKQI